MGTSSLSRISCSEAVSLCLTSKAPESRTYLAHHELESVIVIIISISIIIIVILIIIIIIIIIIIVVVVIVTIIIIINLNPRVAQKLVACREGMPGQAVSTRCAS